MTPSTIKKGGTSSQERRDSQRGELAIANSLSGELAIPYSSDLGWFLRAPEKNSKKLQELFFLRDPSRYLTAALQQ